MSNRLYDILKKLAMVWLPAIGTLYFALAGIWNLPYAEQVVGTITAIDTFLGAILGISTRAYNKAISDPELVCVEKQQKERIASGEFDGKDYTEGD